MESEMVSECGGWWELGNIIMPHPLLYNDIICDVICGMGGAKLITLWL